MEASLPSDKLKELKPLLTVIVVIIVLIILLPLIKTVAKAIKGTADVGNKALQDLGLTSSDAKTYINNVYNSGDYPLFSNYYFVHYEDSNAWNEGLDTPMDSTTAENICNSIKAARGLLFDDDSGVIGIFNQIPTQKGVAYVAKTFQTLNNEDLFHYMRKDDSLFSQGFSAGTLYTIMQNINTKPTS